MRHATRALNYPVQFNYAETKRIGKYRCGIESGKGASGKQPPPCGRGSRRAGQIRGRKVRYRVASNPVGGSSSKDRGCAEGALGEGQIKAREIEIRDWRRAVSHRYRSKRENARNPFESRASLLVT